MKLISKKNQEFGNFLKDQYLNYKPSFFSAWNVNSWWHTTSMLSYTKEKNWFIHSIIDILTNSGSCCPRQRSSLVLTEGEVVGGENSFHKPMLTCVCAHMGMLPYPSLGFSLRVQSAQADCHKSVPHPTLVLVQVSKSSEPPRMKDLLEVGSAEILLVRLEATQ